MVREIHAAILPMQGLGQTLSHWAEIAKRLAESKRQKPRRKRILK